MLFRSPLSGVTVMAANEDRLEVEVVTLAANDILLIQGDKVVGLRREPPAAGFTTVTAGANRYGLAIFDTKRSLSKSL